MRVLPFCLLATLATGCIPQEPVQAPVVNAAIEARLDELASTMEAQVADIHGQLNVLQANSVQRGDLESLSTRINVLSAEIPSLSAFEARLAALETADVSAMGDRIDSIEAMIADLGTTASGDPAVAALVTSLTDELGALEEQVEALESRAADRSDLSTMAATMDADREAIAEELAELTAADAEATTRIDAAQDGIATMSARIDAAESGWNELFEDMALAQTAVQNLATRIDDNAAATQRSVETLTDGLADAAATAAATEARLQREIDDLDTAITSLEGMTDTLDAALDQTFDDVSAVEADLAELEADSIQLVSFNWIRRVTSEETLREALSDLARIRFVDDGKASIYIDDGMNIEGAIKIDHPQGERLSILGDITNRGSVELNFEDVNGFVLTDGARLGKLDGVVITGSAGHTGIIVRRDAALRLGSHVTVRDFSLGIEIEDRGSLDVIGGCGSSGDYDRVLVDEAAGTGIQLTAQSYLNAANCIVEDGDGAGIVIAGNSFAALGNAGSLNNDGVGLDITRGSFVMGTHMDLTDNGSHGLEVDVHSSIDATGVLIDNNGAHGMAVRNGASVIAGDSIVTNNTLTGILARNGAYVHAGDISRGNGDHGVFADEGAVVFGPNLNATQNGSIDVLAEHGAVCRLEDLLAIERNTGTGGTIYSD